MSNHVCCPTDRPAVPGVVKVLDGETIKIAGTNGEPFDCYVVGKSKDWIVVIYDIFGMHANKYELADWIAANCDLSVAVADVRRGKNWPMNLYPPPNAEVKADFSKFLEGDGNFKARGVEVRATIDYLNTNKHADSISLLGFCSKFKEIRQTKT